MKKFSFLIYMMLIFFIVGVFTGCDKSNIPSSEASPEITAEPTPEITPEPTAPPGEEELAKLLSPQPDDETISAETQKGFLSSGEPEMKRGVNFGNMFEGEAEGAWGEWFHDDYFKILKDAGFDNVRIPIKWSIYALAKPPYTINERIFKRIDHVLEKGIEQDMTIIILNIHHYDELATKPKDHRERFLAIWAQISEHYKAYPQKIIFELCNEPNGSMYKDIWNEFVSEVIPIIRVKNPDRMLMVGGVKWNSASELRNLKLPENDKNIIGTFHFYSPMEFTHQGAEWAGDMEKYLGTKWEGTESEKGAITRELKVAKAWSDKTGLPVHLGEFGVYNKADMESRARWTDYVARQAEEMGISWSYWEFSSGFGVYDDITAKFYQELLDALIPKTK